MDSIQALPLSLTNRIPFEVISLILDEIQCYSRNATLYACLRVCHAWYTPLIPRLYECICLRTHAQLDKLTKAVRAHPAVRARLASTRKMLLLWQRGREYRSIDALPLVLGPYLHGVTSLTFYWCMPKPLHPSFFVALPLLASVTHLKLAYLYLASFLKLHSIVCAFPFLKELSLQGPFGRARRQQLTTPALPNHQGPSTKLRTPRLTVLRVCLQAPDALRSLAAWISTTTSLASITTLDILHIIQDGEDDEPISALLACTAAAVEHLRVEIINNGAQPIVLVYHSRLKSRSVGIGRHLMNCFGGLAQLKTLDTTLMWLQDITSDKITQQLHDILSVLSILTLQSLRLELAAQSVITPSGSDLQVQDVASDADINQYEDLHAVLARPIFTHLTNATIIVISRYTRTEDAIPKKGLPVDLLALLRMLFAPWCYTRAHTRFVSSSWNSGEYAGVVSTCSDEEVRWVAGQGKKDAEG